MGYDRLEERLLRRAGAGVNDVEFGIGDAPEEPLDAELALNLLRNHRPTVEGQRKRRGGPVQRASREEAEAALALQRHDRARRQVQLPARRLDALDELPVGHDAGTLDQRSRRRVVAGQTLAEAPAGRVQRPGPHPHDVRQP